MMTVSVNVVPVAWMQVKKRMAIGRGYFTAADATDERPFQLSNLSS